MANVAKREDAMLDTIGQYRDRKLATLYWLAEFEEKKMIHPFAARILRKSLTEDITHGDQPKDEASVSRRPDDGDSGVQQG